MQWGVPGFYWMVGKRGVAPEVASSRASLQNRRVAPCGLEPVQSITVGAWTSKKPSNRLPRGPEMWRGLLSAAGRDKKYGG